MLLILYPIDKNCTEKKYKLISGIMDIIRKNIILFLKKNKIPGLSFILTKLGVKLSFTVPLINSLA